VPKALILRLNNFFVLVAGCGHLKCNTLLGNTFACKVVSKPAGKINAFAETVC
jgi:hypothetical protein